MKTRNLIDLLEWLPLLTKQDLAQYYGVTVRTIERRVNLKKLPQPIRVCGPRWKPAQLELWEKHHALRTPTGTFAHHD
jgi:hypothetical protein